MRKIIILGLFISILGIGNQAYSSGGPALVYGTGSVLGVIETTTNNSFARLWFKRNGAAIGSIGADKDGNFTLNPGANDGSDFVISPNGNVGIGTLTTTPARLNVINPTAHGISGTTYRVSSAGVTGENKVEGESTFRTSGWLASNNHGGYFRSYTGDATRSITYLNTHSGVSGENYGGENSTLRSIGLLGYVNYGVHGKTQEAGGAGIRGESNISNVFGELGSGTTGVRGLSNAGVGVFGATFSNTSVGILGEYRPTNSITEGRVNYGYLGHYNHGIYGKTFLTTGAGVVGNNHNNTSSGSLGEGNYGVRGTSTSGHASLFRTFIGTGIGVIGENRTTTDNGTTSTLNTQGRLGMSTYGVYGNANVETAAGVIGYAFNSAVYGILGKGTNSFEGRGIIQNNGQVNATRYCDVNGNNCLTPGALELPIQSGIATASRDGQTQNVNVTFSKQFSVAPTVFISLIDFEYNDGCRSDNLEMKISATNITRTGFTAVLPGTGKCGGSQDVLKIQWLAFIGDSGSYTVTGATGTGGSPSTPSQSELPTCTVGQTLTYTSTGWACQSPAPAPQPTKITTGKMHTNTNRNTTTTQRINFGFTYSTAPKVVLLGPATTTVTCQTGETGEGSGNQAIYATQTFAYSVTNIDTTGFTSVYTVTSSGSGSCGQGNLEWLAHP